MPIKKSVRLVDDTIKVCNNLTKTGGVNWSGSINAMAELFTTMIEENTPNLTPDQWNAFYCAYNGRIQHPDIREEAKMLHWNVSEGYQHDEQIRTLIGSETDAVNFTQRVNQMTITQKIAIIYKANAFWRQGPIADDGAGE